MRELKNKVNVDAPDSDYPFGRARNNPGNRTGTPVDEELLGDILQFFEKLFSESGLVANEMPDNDYSGFQLFEALKVLINPDGIITRKKDIGDWNMQTTGNISVPLPDGVTIDKVIGIEVYILSDPIVGIINGTSLMKGVSGADVLSGFYNTYSTANEVVLNRIAGGLYDSVNYSGTPYNRGYVIIKYIP